MKYLFQNHIRILSISVIVLLIYVVFSYNNAHGKSKIYWSENGKIRRANLNGTSVEDIVFLNKNPVDIAIDSKDRSIFWISPEGAAIQRANLDGTNIENVVSNVASFCIALDIQRKKIYWSPFGNKGIHHANYDGSEVADNLKKMPARDFARISIVMNMEVDSSSEKIYWTDLMYQNIKRVNFDGTFLKDFDIDRHNRPIGLALDVNNGHLYWSTNRGFIKRSSLNGSRVKTLITGLDFPSDIRLDLYSQKIYWLSSDKQSTNSKIQRANLDGSNIKDILTGLENVDDFALYTEELYDVSPDIQKLTTTWANIKTQ